MEKVKRGGEREERRQEKLDLKKDKEKSICQAGSFCAQQC